MVVPDNGVCKEMVERRFGGGTGQRIWTTMGDGVRRWVGAAGCLAPSSSSHAQFGFGASSIPCGEEVLID